RVGRRLGRAGKARGSRSPSRSGDRIAPTAGSTAARFGSPLGRQPAGRDGTTSRGCPVARREGGAVTRSSFAAEFYALFDINRCRYDAPKPLTWRGSINRIPFARSALATRLRPMRDRGTPGAWRAGSTLVP